ncbi:hypothetical protein EGT65_04380 [Burkholderia mallei]|nr:hypothetical protein EGT65_04380 [Burkholderia mallei]
MASRPANDSPRRRAAAPARGARPRPGQARPARLAGPARGPGTAERRPENGRRPPAPRERAATCADHGFVVETL